MKPSVNEPLKFVRVLMVTSRWIASSLRPLSWTRTVFASGAAAMRGAMKAKMLTIEVYILAVVWFSRKVGLK